MSNDLMEASTHLTFGIMSLFLFLLVIWLGESVQDNTTSGFKIYAYIPYDLGCKHRTFDHAFYKERSAIFKAAGEKVFLFNEAMEKEGEHVNIFYSPGVWPRILYRTVALDRRTEKSARSYICGGIPQKCNIQEHVGILRKLFKEKPKKNQESLGIIAANHWRPVYRQNTRWDRVIYQIESVNLELNDPKNNQSDIIKEKAEHAFEKAGFEWFKSTIDEAVFAKDKIHWGFMGIPGCYTQKTTDGSCSIFSRQDNIRMSPIIQASTALYPTAILEDPKMFQSPHYDADRYLRNLVTETFKVARLHRPRKYIAVILHYKYRNGPGISLEDMIKYIVVLCQQGVDAVLIYGDYKDAANCPSTFNYFSAVIEKVSNSSKVVACVKHWYQKPLD